MRIEYDEEVAQRGGYYETDNNFWRTCDDHSDGVAGVPPGINRLSAIMMSMIIN